MSKFRFIPYIFYTYCSRILSCIWTGFHGFLEWGSCKQLFSRQYIQRIYGCEETSGERYIMHLRNSARKPNFSRSLDQIPSYQKKSNALMLWDALYLWQLNGLISLCSSFVFSSWINEGHTKSHKKRKTICALTC